MSIRVGTCGWSYDDWEGPVYQRGTPPGERLKVYAERFPIVEIDSTFYRDPPPAVVKGWIDKVRDKDGFEFSAKLPQDLTHDLMANAPPDACARRAASWAALVAAPLDEAGRLGVVVAQLSPGVLHTRDAMARLDATLAALRPFAIAVEFRNKTWHTGSALKDDAVALLDRHDAAAVIVDGPSFPPIVGGNATHAYARFHGRNEANWFRRDASLRRHASVLGGKPTSGRDATREDRYDYRYSEDELRPWAAKLAEIARRRIVRVFFNNHVRGKAMEDGVEMEALLEREGAPLERVSSAQTRLF